MSTLTEFAGTQKSYPPGHVLYNSSASGYKLRVVVRNWEAGELIVTCFDSSTVFRFLQGFEPSETPDVVFRRIMLTVRSLQHEYARDELFLLKADKGKCSVH
jgi:hypothetical protein